MTRFFVLSLISFSLFFQAFSQDDKDTQYSISVSVDGWSDSVTYLGYYISDKTYLQDTAKVINGKAVFKGDEALSSGMYFVYTPNSLFFEFLFSESSISISTTLDEASENLRSIDSKENILFFNYQKQMMAMQKEAGLLSEEYKKLSGADSLAKLSELKNLNDRVKSFQLSERDNNEGTYFAELLSLMIRPKISIPKELSEEEANAYNFFHYKKNFWDGTDFTNPGTIRNPLFEPKLNEYFDKLVYNVADSVNEEIDQLLTLEMDSVVYRYLIVTLTNKYANSKLMGMDAVYVHMVDEYYITRKAYWIDDVTLTRMKQNSDRFKPILIGQKAPLFKSESIAGTQISNPFTTTSKDYKIVFFYDSGCGHCKKATPKLMASYKALQEVKISADIISMNLSEDTDEWKTFVKTYGLEGQILGDPKGISNAGYYYYVDTTPQIFILDKDNKIIAKKLNADKVADFIIDYNQQFETKN